MEIDLFYGHFLQWYSDFSNVFKAIKTHLSNEILLRAPVNKQNKGELLRLKTNCEAKSTCASAIPQESQSTQGEEP